MLLSDVLRSATDGRDGHRHRVDGVRAGPLPRVTVRARPAPEEAGGRELSTEAVDNLGTGVDDTRPSVHTPWSGLWKRSEQHRARPF